MNIIQFNNWAKANIIDKKKFNDNGFIIMKNDNNYKSTGVISQIVENHLDDVYKKHKDGIDRNRPNKEVNKN